MSGQAGWNRGYSIFVPHTGTGLYGGFFSSGKSIRAQNKEEENGRF